LVACYSRALIAAALMGAGRVGPEKSTKASSHTGEGTAMAEHPSRRRKLAFSLIVLDIHAFAILVFPAETRR
jgi:hypothetical protein